MQSGLPDDLPGRGYGRGTFRPEVHVDAIAFDDRRRRRVAVLRIQQRRVAQAKDLDIHRRLPGGSVERHQSKGTLATDGCRGREPYASVNDNRR
jgi:hypothetical protein